MAFVLKRNLFAAFADGYKPQAIVLQNKTTTQSS
jgi:hypothetical protein